MPAAENPRAVAGNNSHKIARDTLKALVERIEKLEEERKAVSDDIRDIYAEAKATGFDVKALRRAIALRKLDPSEVEECSALVEMYLNALGTSTDKGVFA